jgi:hypothetical protein
VSRDGSEKLGPNQEELRDLLRVEGVCEMVALGYLQPSRASSSVSSTVSTPSAATSRSRARQVYNGAREGSALALGVSPEPGWASWRG